MAALSDRAGRRARFTAMVEAAQESICAGLEALDGRGRFGRDPWQRPGGGGGLTRVLAEGGLFERAGVNVSVVHGSAAPPAAAAGAGGAAGAGKGSAGAGDPLPFFAAGLSLILHPRSPMVPTVHLNVRYLERGDDAWFGGGSDLTPYYLFAEDARHFHAVLRSLCDRHGPDSYRRFKSDCDAYFQVRHRREARGIGGIFFDELREPAAAAFGLCADLAGSFLAAYVPIAERRRGEAWGDRERRWQLLRRGRYVEFNLVHDRGTRFGLESDGRIESILVSLPPLVAWEYQAEPEPGSREAELVAVLRAPRDWLDLGGGS